MNNTEASTTTGTPSAPEQTRKTRRTASKPAKERAKSKATRKKSAKQARNGAKPARATAGTKTALVLDLLRRKEGATIADIAAATDWQNHSIRGFISGTVAKKMGMSVESLKNEAKERTYRIAE
jgi:hypothetical protein